MEGLLILKGTHIKRNHWLGKAEIIDATPTLLHLLEIPIPQGTDGKVLKDVFEPDSFPAQREIRFAWLPEREDSAGPEQVLDEAVRKQLQDLGYL
jgi:hypothetical protein